MPWRIERGRPGRRSVSLQASIGGSRHTRKGGAAELIGSGCRSRDAQWDHITGVKGIRWR